MTGQDTKTGFIWIASIPESHLKMVQVEDFKDGVGLNQSIFFEMRVVDVLGRLDFGMP